VQHSLTGAGLPGLARIEPGLIVIGAIISMLAGLAILGASEDAISGLYVTGTAHAIHGLIVTIGLVIGASVVVAGASWLGIPVWINAQFGIDGLLGPRAPGRGRARSPRVPCQFFRPPQSWGRGYVVPSVSSSLKKTFNACKNHA